MTSKDKDLPKDITHPDLLKSIQELGLTLNLLKALASDLKYQLDAAAPETDVQNTGKPKPVIEPHSTLH